MTFPNMDNEEDTLRIFLNSLNTMYGDTPTAMSAIADLNQTISGTYTQAEVQAISDKVDALLAALRTLGILAT